MTLNVKINAYIWKTMLAKRENLCNNMRSNMYV